MERPGATTMRGNPLTLIGPELKAGDAAPDFAVVDSGLKPVSLKEP
jgi:thiol peroxidase